MEFQSPFIIETIEDVSKGVRELHFTFTQGFQSLNSTQQLTNFETYLAQLTTDMNETNDPAEKQGILTVLQISEQLLPHLKANEIPLHETIIVEMGEQTEGTSLTELFNSSKLN